MTNDKGAASMIHDDYETGMVKDVRSYDYALQPDEINRLASSRDSADRPPSQPQSDPELQEALRAVAVAFVLFLSVVASYVAAKSIEADHRRVQSASPAGRPQ